MFGDFLKPEMAFRLFLTRFGTPEGIAELRGILAAMELDADDVAKLTPVLKMAYDEMSKRDSQKQIAA